MKIVVEFFPPSFALPIKQAFLIANMNGLLWLRRYPASITFTAMIPFAFLFIVFVIGGGQYTHMAFAGSLVSAAAGYGLATGNNIITWKVDYKMQDIFVASPVSSFTYMAGIALAELLFGLPAFVILAALVVIFSSDFFVQHYHYHSHAFAGMGFHIKHWIFHIDSCNSS